MQIDNYIVLISGQYNVFNEGWNGAGIYACSGNYVSSVFTNPIYIGSAKNLQRRIEYDHISHLERNKHPHNPPLQIAWNNHSKNEGFIWLLLESCSTEREILLDVEQKYLDLYRPFVDEFGGFNVGHQASSAAKGISGENNPNFGRKFSEETKRKMSKSQKGKKRSEQTKKKLSDMRRGEKHHYFGKHRSEEDRIKIMNSSPQSRTFFLKNPNGEVVEIFNLSKFCRENNLNRRSMQRVLSGKRKNHKGWTKINLVEKTNNNHSIL